MVGGYMNTSKSRRLYNEAAALMPGGVNSPVRSFGSVGRSPIFIERAFGNKIQDADGNTYDFAFGLNWQGIINDDRVKKYK